MSKKCKYIAAWQWIRTKMWWQPTWHFRTNLMLVCYQALHITISTEILHKPFIWPQFLVLSPSPSLCLLSLKEKVAVHPLHNISTTERGPITKCDSFLPIDRKLSKYHGRCPSYMRHKKVEESWPQLPTPLLFWRCRTVLWGKMGVLAAPLQEVAAGGVHLLHDAVRVLGRVVDVGLVVRESFTNFVWSW